jgi:hypothetical protein
MLRMPFYFKLKNAELKMLTENPTIDIGEGGGLVTKIKRCSSFGRIRCGIEIQVL